jgi:Tfp pilus assembly protein PilZ
VTTTTWASLPIAGRRAWVTPVGDAQQGARVAGGISLLGWW